MVDEYRGHDADKLIERIRVVGRRLSAAQPTELVVGNIARRVLGLVREVLENDVEADLSELSDSRDQSSPGSPANNAPNRPSLTSSISTFSPLRYGATEPVDPRGQQDTSLPEAAHLTKRPTLMSSATSYAGPMGSSLFGLFSAADRASPSGTPLGAQTPNGPGLATKQDLKSEVLDGIAEMLEELEVVDEQIAGFSLEHIHANELILTYAPDTTVRKFLVAAARKRKFTVYHALDMMDTADDAEYVDALTKAGVKVNLIPYSNFFAVMPRMQKVILSTSAMYVQGGLLAPVGTRGVAQVAKRLSTHVLVLGGVYQLSPVHPFDPNEHIEHGDAGQVVDFRNATFVENIDVENPLSDYVPPDLIDLFVTNL